MNQLDSMLDNLSAYADVLTDNQLGKIEKDINVAKLDEGTKIRAEFDKALKLLEEGRKALKDYRDSKHSELLEQANKVLAALEQLRDTGNTRQGTVLLAKLDLLVKAASPLDDELNDLLSKTSTVSIESATLDRFGKPGKPKRAAFEDKAIDIRHQIKQLRNERGQAAVSAFTIIAPEINKGIQVIKAKTKRGEAIVAALNTLNTLLGIVGKVVSLV
jgi:hypothetical protein